MHFLLGADVHAVDGTGRTLLHCAAEIGSADMTEMLMQSPFFLEPRQQDENNSPLCAAVKNRSVDVCKVYLKYGRNF